MAPLHSFKLMGPKFKLRNFTCYASWKRIHSALNLHCSSYISRIVWWLPMFDFGIFCHLLRLMGIYWVGAPVRVFEKFCSLFFLPFFFFYSSFFYSLFFPLSRGPLLAPGPLDIVHPCHPVATPLWRWCFYVTHIPARIPRTYGSQTSPGLKIIMTNHFWITWVYFLIAAILYFHRNVAKVVGVFNFVKQGVIFV